uniref:NLR family, CARD domain containing 3-like 1 n=1 Tax=Mastacembelus armatus TaxID=205130 RepID=A0A3Q3M2B0_9TELE
MDPALSYGSMSSEDASDRMDDSDRSSTKAKSKDAAIPEFSETPELIQDPNQIRHPSLTVAFTFKTICHILGKLTEKDLKSFKAMLWKRYPQSFITPPESMDLVDLVDRILECYSLEVAFQITKALLVELKQEKLIEYLEVLCLRNEVRYELCETLKRTYGDAHKDQVFTNLSITSASDTGPNIEHEVMKIEKLDSNREEGKALSTKDIMGSENQKASSVKLVVLIGSPGSGKSMAVRQLILDWIEERSHQHVSFLFPLPFRELKQFEGSKHSLLNILHKFYPETKKLRDQDYRSQDCKIMFVFDGLDEYDGNIDFRNTEYLGDHKNPVTLKCLVVNLLRGKLLYRSLCLITTRSPVSRYIPWDTFYNEMDLLGFRDSDKDEYFKKRFQNPDQAAQVLAYINSFKTLRIMCHLPLFCSLVADEWQQIFQGKGTQAALPRGITYMYTKFFLELTQHRRKLRAPDRSPDEERDFLMKLGKLAFTMLEKGQFKIVKTELKDTGISDREAVLNSGLCIQFITKPYVLYEEKVLSFIHPTMQEYLAALYVFLSFRNQGKNIYEQHLKEKLKGIFKGQKVMELYKCAMDRSLLCEDGKLDIFLRFLFGMAVKTNLELLQPFCTSSDKWPTFTEDAATLIRKKLKENPSRSDNLGHCLEELGLSAPQAASC